MNEQTIQSDFLDGLTPRQIVEELDTYIIGQHNAKKLLL